AAEAEAQRQHVSVTLCIVDESGNLLFLQKGDTAPINTVTWAQRKARHAAFYNAPSKDAEDAVKKGHVEALAYGILSEPRRTADCGGWPAGRRHGSERRQVRDRRSRGARSARFRH